MDESTQDVTPPSRRTGSYPILVAALVALVLLPHAGRAHAQQVEADDGGVDSAGAQIRAPVPDDLEDLAARASQATVRLDVRTPSGTRQGSGFLVDSGGRLLTNAHVIRDAESVRVRLASGDVYDRVSILALDERRDIGVVQIPGFDLPSLPLGNSDSVRIGGSVVLIGSPLGLENTVSTGIVSGRRQEPEGFQLLQITAPASRGSSGGAVLSTDGQVVAVAASQLQAGQNLNFAVPINYARGLLANLPGDPIAILSPTADASRDSEPMSDDVPMTDRVNANLRFGTGAFQGYSIESQATLRDDRERRTRITYRRIETIGGGPPRIERYLERETTMRTGPFDTRQTIERERSRTIIRADELQPLAAQGETSYWSGDAWQTETYDLRFEDGRARGVIRDSTGQTLDVDRQLPRGVILRPVRHLAFGLLETEPLVGRSVELVTYDPSTSELVTDRYDVQERTSIEVDGESQESLRVSVASGLSNSTAFFRIDRPRVLLRQVRQSPNGSETEDVTSLDFFTPPDQ